MNAPKPVRLSVPEYRRRIAANHSEVIVHATDPQVQELAKVIAEFWQMTGDDDKVANPPAALDVDLARHIVRSYRRRSA